MGKQISIEEIHVILARNHDRKLDGASMSRELHITPITNDHTKIGSVIFSLDGSPPKGYAIYIRELHTVCFYDNHGTRFKRLSNHVVGNDNPLNKFDMKKLKQEDVEDEQVQEDNE